MGHETDVPLEEQEKWNLDRERDADALKDYTKVERVIGKDEDEEGDVVYYVKCKKSDNSELNIRLTQDREGPLLRFVHLGERKPGQRDRTERNRPLLGSSQITTAIRQSRVQSEYEEGTSAHRPPTVIHQARRAP